MAGARAALTFCRICQAQCGLVIELDGDRVTRVSGDADHPVSRGYTCSKGRALGELHHAEGRLDDPILHGETSTWDVVLADLGTRLRRIVDEHGPDSVALYRSTGWILDTNGRAVVDRWVRALGTRQLYSPNTIDTPNRMVVPDLVAGAPFLQPVVDWANTQLLIVLGHNLVVSHGHAAVVPDALRRVREIKARGGHVVVADPRITETVRLADVHLQIRPGTDAALAAFLVAVRLRGRCDSAYLETCADTESVERLRAAIAPYDRDTVARICDVDAADLDRVASLLLSVDRVSYVSGTGVSMGPAPNATEWLGWALGAVTGSLDREGGILFNPGVLRPQSESGPVSFARVTGPPPASRPEFEHTYGEYPSAILCDEILAGNVRAVVSFGGNIVASFPDTAKTLAALASLEVFAVTEIRHTQTTAVATHVLATTDQLERPDVGYFLDQAYPIPFAQYTPAVVTPAANRRSLSNVMVDLAQEMDLDIGIRTYADEEELLRSIIKRSRVSLDELKANPSGVVVENVPRWNWLVPDRVPKGRLDLAPLALVAELETWGVSEQLAADDEAAADETGTLRLICRRLPHQMNSGLQELPAQQRAPFATLLMHERDADRRGMSDGDAVVVSTRSGCTDAVVELTDRIRPGVVSLPHSWSNPAVNKLTSTDGLEPLTGMPRFTGIPVSVTPAQAR